jgi:hypothetical protein
MIEAAIYILIGAFIGWNLPQPAWAKNIQDKVIGMLGRRG